MNRSSNQTLHGNVSDFIRTKVYDKEWGPNARIPSEHALMDEFGVSRGTVRKALKTLVDEGMLQQEHGRGTFVRETRIEHSGGGQRFSFAESLTQQGIQFTTREIAREQIPASPDVALHLRIRRGEPVMRMRRVREVAGEPVMVLDSWTPLARCPGIADMAMEETSLFNAAEACTGARIGKSSMTYSARSAGKEVAALLGVPEGSPVLNLQQLVTLEDGRPIEWSDTMLRAGQTITGEVFGVA